MERSLAGILCNVAVRSPSNSCCYCEILCSRPIEIIGLAPAGDSKIALVLPVMMVGNRVAPAVG